MVYCFRTQLEPLIILPVHYLSTSINTYMHKCGKATIALLSSGSWHSLFFSCGASGRINQLPLVANRDHQLQKDLHGQEQTSTTFLLSSVQLLLSASNIRSLLHYSSLKVSYDPFLFPF